MQNINKIFSWHKTYIQIANVISSHSYDPLIKVGCIIVKNKSIISYGYNGTLPGLDNETRVNLKTKKEVVHAECNAILKCAKEGYNLNNSTIYCTHSPCVECSKLIIQSGIKTVVFNKLYCKKGLKILNDCNIEYLSI